MVSTIRASVAHQVRHMITQAGIPLSALYGSWAFGDYHLDVARLRTFSDLDLVLPSDNDSKQRLQALERSLPSVVPMRITVRQHDDLGGDIPAVCDRWITIVGFASAAATSKMKSQKDYRVYAEAKTLLMLLRENRLARYAEIARKLAGEDAHNALSIKIGVADHWSKPGHVWSLAGAVEEPFRSVFLEIVEHGTVTQETVAKIQYGLDCVASQMPTTLMEHTAAKLAVVGRVSG